MGCGDESRVLHLSLGSLLTLEVPCCFVIYFLGRRDARTWNSDYK
jgi:hypothetical protein